MYDDDRDLPQERDLTPEDASVDLVSCPECGAAVYEAAEKCHRCGAWIVSYGADRHSRPWWIMAVAILLLVSFMLWVVF